MNDPKPQARTERDLFLAALEFADPRQQAVFLDQACAHDPHLRQRVQTLLAEHQRLGTFLATPALGDTPLLPRPATGPSGTSLLASVHEKAGDRIGRYRLLQQIGEGGCGVVFMAEQEEPVRRRVALKVIKLGMDTKSVIARFEAERQALAMMDHQNIARVLDAGATDTGRPFFVMELVRGVRITDYCDQHKLSTRDRITLFLQVCQAVQHAHQKGIIHRDLKPSNILVTVNDGLPVPKVIDFGIAKATEQRLTEKTLFTEFTAFIGTPAYMSPEQAEMSSLDIDTRSDIYSLGVLLYELLTGRTPFDAEILLRGGLDECRRTIREQEPLRPSTRLGDLSIPELTTTASQRCTDAPKLLHALRGDLDWIVMKCLEKDRTRRFATANALALDLQRYLDNEPVLARPPSTVYRLRKLLRRHRLVVTATSAVALALLAGATISIWQAFRAMRAEATEAGLRQAAEKALRRAQTSEAAARLNEYIADMSLAQQSLAAGNFGRAVQLVDKHRPRPGEPDLRGFEWRYLWQICLGDQRTPIATLPAAVQSLALHPNGQLAALAVRDHVQILDLTSRSPVASLPREAQSLAFLPDGRTLLTANRGSVRPWPTATWTEPSPLPELSAPIALSHHGTRLAAQSRRGTRVLDTSSWQTLAILPDTFGPFAFSHDGAILATDTRDGLTLWPLTTNLSPTLLQDSTNLFFRAGPWFRADRALAFSPDGAQIVAVRNPPSTRGVFVLSVWDASTGHELAVMPGDPDQDEHTGMISSLAFSPDGQLLATASFDHSIRIWDFPKRRLLRALHGHRNEVWALDFSPDGRYLLSGAKDGAVSLWPVQPQNTEDLLPPNASPLGFSPDSQTVALLTSDGTVAFYNLTTREIEDEFDLDWPRFGPPGSRPPGERPPGERPPGERPPGERPPGDQSPGDRRPGDRLPQKEGPGPNSPAPRREGRGFGFFPSFALSADLQTLALTTNQNAIALISTSTHETSLLELPNGRHDIIALSPNGRVLLTSGRDRQVHWWEPEQNPDPFLTFDGLKALFSPNGQRLATLQNSNLIQIWNVPHRTLLTNLVVDPPLGFPFPMAFSPDGAVLATAAALDSVDNGIHLWDTATAQPLGSCYGHKQPVHAMAFTPDGRTLASSADDGTVKFWNLATRQELLSVRKSGSPPRSLLFSPDSRLLLGASGPFGPPASLRVFRAPSLEEIDRPAQKP